MITTGAISYLAQKFPAGAIIDGSIPEDTSSLPGFSTQSGVGLGKIRFFGTGNFGSGEVGYVGVRFSGGAFYGWAEVSAIDSTSFTVHRIAYEDSGGPIEVGDTGPQIGVASITRGGLGNAPTWNWPAGTWFVAAVLLDESGSVIGGLSQGFSVVTSGSVYPAFVEVEMLATATSLDRIRVFRKQSAISPGDTGVEFADYLCDDGGGGVEAICDASAPSPVGGGFGQLRETEFTGVGTVPDGSLGVGHDRSRRTRQRFRPELAGRNVVRERDPARFLRPGDRRSVRGIQCRSGRKRVPRVRHGRDVRRSFPFGSDPRVPQTEPDQPGRHQRRVRGFRL